MWSDLLDRGSREGWTTLRLPAPVLVRAWGKQLSPFAGPPHRTPLVSTDGLPPRTAPTPPAAMRLKRPVLCSWNVPATEPLLQVRARAGGPEGHCGGSQPRARLYLPQYSCSPLSLACFIPTRTHPHTVHTGLCREEAAEGAQGDDGAGG